MAQIARPLPICLRIRSMAFSMNEPIVQFRLASADIENKPPTAALAVFGMRHFGMKLNAEDLPLRILHRRHRRFAFAP